MTAVFAAVCYNKTTFSEMKRLIAERGRSVSSSSRFTVVKSVHMITTRGVSRTSDPPISAPAAGWRPAVWGEWWLISKVTEDTWRTTAIEYLSGVSCAGRDLSHEIQAWQKEWRHGSVLMCLSGSAPQQLRTVSADWSSFFIASLIRYRRTAIIAHSR